MGVEGERHSRENTCNNKRSLVVTGASELAEEGPNCLMTGKGVKQCIPLCDLCHRNSEQTHTHTHTHLEFAAFDCLHFSLHTLHLVEDTSDMFMELFQLQRKSVIGQTHTPQTGCVPGLHISWTVSEAEPPV